MRRLKRDNFAKSCGLAILPTLALGSAAHASTSYSTANVECPYSESHYNGSIKLTSQASWSCSGGNRVLSANGIPDHSVGAFPNEGNPNTIAAQTVSQSITTAPSYTGTATQAKVIGYALNGIKFDPGTAQTCTSGCGNNGQTSSGQWHIEALGQNYFYLGTDFNNAHVQPGGAYHYHGLPNGILMQAGLNDKGDSAIASASSNTGRTMTLLGWAIDGFPIYGHYGYKIASEPAKGLKVLNASYRIKPVLSAGRPSASIAPAGTFTEDYQYVAGQGDLDQCNGRFGVTPEFPSGIYYYVITDTFPFAPRCLMGNVPAMPPPPPPPSKG